MIRWTGLAPWELEFPFQGSLASTFLLPNAQGLRPSTRLFNTVGGVVLYEKATKLKLSGNQVYYTACYLLVLLKNSCGKLHDQTVLI